MKNRPLAVTAFLDHCVGIPDKSLNQWRKMSEAWEKDPTKPNPFESKTKREFFVALSVTGLKWLSIALTYNKARLALAKEDEERLEKDPRGRIIDVKMSPLQLITQGIEFEESQYVDIDEATTIRLTFAS